MATRSRELPGIRDNSWVNYTINILGYHRWTADLFNIHLLYLFFVAVVLLTTDCKSKIAWLSPAIFIFCEKQSAYSNTVWNRHASTGERGWAESVQMLKAYVWFLPRAPNLLQKSPSPLNSSVGSTTGLEQSIRKLLIFIYYFRVSEVVYISPNTI